VFPTREPTRVSRVREAMIVAGGAGTRLLPLTSTTPKPLLPFCGAPFLEGVLRRLRAVGIDRVFLVVGADTRPFDPLAASARTFGVEVEAVPEPEPLDTAGGVRAALDRVTGTFLVLNGDILTDVDLEATIAAHHGAGAAATLVLTRVEDTSTFGVCVRDGTRIVDFVEKPAPGTLPGQDTVNAGTYVLEPAALERFPVGRLSFERQVFPDLVAAGDHLEGFVDDGVWADLGTPERFLAGHRLALEGALSWPTLADLPPDEHGVRRADDVEVAPSASLHGPVLLGDGVRVGAGAVLGPNVTLGAGTVVGAGAQLSDTVTFPGCQVGAGVHATGLLAGARSRIGEGARLGHEVVLGDGGSIDAQASVPGGTRLPAPATNDPRPTRRGRAG
jgi:NDP-sugar pyrophosphorylase family protein